MFVIKEGTPADKVGEGTAPEVLESITKHLSKGGFVIRKADEDENFVKTRVQTEVDKVYGTTAKMFDGVVTEITGIPRLDNEKSTDYAKRAVAEKLKAVNELQAQLKELKDKGVDGNVLAQEYKGQIGQLQEQIKKINEENGKTITELKGKMFETSLSSMVDHAFSEIRSTLGAEGLDPKYLTDIINARMLRFRNENRAKEVEGILIWTDKDGNIRNSKTNGKPLSTKEILEPYFEDLVDKGKKGAGAGSGKGGDGGQGDAKWKNLTVPSEIKSKPELYKWLKVDNKMDENSKDFNDAYTALGANLPLERKR